MNQFRIIPHYPKTTCFFLVLCIRFIIERRRKPQPSVSSVILFLSGTCLGAGTNIHRNVSTWTKKGEPTTVWWHHIAHAIPSSNCCCTYHFNKHCFHKQLSTEQGFDFKVPSAASTRHITACSAFSTQLSIHANCFPIAKVSRWYESASYWMLP